MRPLELNCGRFGFQASQIGLSILVRFGFQQRDRINDRDFDKISIKVDRFDQIFDQFRSILTNFD